MVEMKRCEKSWTRGVDGYESSDEDVRQKVKKRAVRQKVDVR